MLKAFASKITASDQGAQESDPIMATITSTSVKMMGVPARGDGSGGG